MPDQNMSSETANVGLCGAYYGSVSGLLFWGRSFFFFLKFPEFLSLISLGQRLSEILFEPGKTLVLSLAYRC